MHVCFAARQLQQQAVGLSQLHCTCPASSFALAAGGAAAVRRANVSAADAFCAGLLCKAAASATPIGKCVCCCAHLKHVLLGGIVQDAIEFELQQRQRVALHGENNQLLHL
jgi:hypothetical protein